MNFENKNVLKLTLTAEWFWLMFAGMKKLEIRNPSKWIIPRMSDKEGNYREYDFIEFRNGYGKTRPVFWVEFHKISQSKIAKEFVFRDREGNPHKVEVEKFDFLIRFGEVVHSENCTLKFA